MQNDDLISRSECAAFFKSRRFADPYPANYYQRGYNCAMSDAIRHVRLNAPAVDAVPVVRCNMCKYYEQDTGFCQYFGGGNHWDGFCNNGARMDAEGDK